MCTLYSAWIHSPFGLSSSCLPKSLNIIGTTLIKLSFAVIPEHLLPSSISYQSHGIDFIFYASFLDANAFEAAASMHVDIFLFRVQFVVWPIFSLNIHTGHSYIIYTTVQNTNHPFAWLTFSARFFRAQMPVTVLQPSLAHTHWMTISQSLLQICNYSGKRNENSWKIKIPIEMNK